MLPWPFWLPLLAWLTVLPGQVPPQATPSNQQAKQVVAQVIAAMGGDLYLQDTERSGNGRMFTFQSNGQLADAGTEFWSYQRFPAEERVEVGPKRDVVYIYTGGQGWEITYKGVEPMLRKQLLEYNDVSAHSLDVILKTWASNPNTLMLYDGLSMVDQDQVESVSFTTASGDSATLDVDLSTHLPVRVSWRHEDPETGGHYEESMLYGNWIGLGGIETPYSLDHFEGDEKLDQRFYKNIEFAPFPDALLVPTKLGKKHK